MFGIGKALFEHYGNGLLAQSTVPQEDVTWTNQIEAADHAFQKACFY